MRSSFFRVSRTLRTSTRSYRQQSPPRGLFATAVPPLLVSAGIALASRQSKAPTCLDRSSSSKDQSSTRSKNEKESSIFDLTSAWEAVSKDKETLSPSDFWKKVLAGDKKVGEQEPPQQKEKMPSEGGGFQAMASGLMSLVTGANKKEEETISDVVAKARENLQQGELHDSTSVEEAFDTLKKYQDMIALVAEKYVGDIDLSKLTVSAIHYYIEYEDERKNPSWKNRVHRFCNGIDMAKIEKLHDALDLALLTYVDTVDEIKEGLAKGRSPAELVYADVKSDTGKPAHFIAVRLDQSTSSRELEVLMGVRGTKSLADAVTDILCDTENYRDGKAHQMILASGKYLFDKHRALLEDLCKKAKKSKIKLILVGHSLGAGAASIAGLEFNALDNFDVQVVGFGCPALVSKDVAEKATFITTVVNDSDCVPRMSAATVTNLLLNLVEFDWLPYAKKDVRQSLGELQSFSPSIFDDKLVRKIRNTLEPLMDEHLGKLIEKDLTNRVQPELFPPGRIIHLYRDGYGVSGCFVPNTFFKEIDVTRRMVDDHVFHSGYQQVFLEIMRQHKGDHHYRFDEKAEND